VLDRERHVRNSGRRRPDGAAGKGKDRSAVGMLLVHGQVAAHVRGVGVAAAIEDGDDAFVLVELLELRLKLLRGLTAAAGLIRGIVRSCVAAAGGGLSTSPAASSLRRHRRRLRLFREVAIHADDERPLQHAHRAGRLREDDLSLQLPLVAREVGVVRDRGAHDLSGDDAVGRRRPRPGKPDERLDLRRDEVCAEAIQRPAAPEVPVLAVDVREAPLRHLLHRPRARLVHRGRTGEARPVAIGQPEKGLHRLRASESLITDLRDGGIVELLGLRLCRRCSFRLQAESSGHRSRNQKSEQSNPAHIRRILSSSRTTNTSSAMTWSAH
jgi:hypothetical protein